jgi:4'-phosphopantetheinyl transferase
VEIYWVEQSLSDVPVDNGWLAESELRCLERLRIPKRRDDWRLGRWTAKRAIATVLGPPKHDFHLTQIEVLAASSGAPEAYVGHQPASVSISLSHRNGVAACALAQSTIPLGCDLELIEPRSNAFVCDYFTDKEQAYIASRSASERDQLVAILWGSKESALKALRLGLTVDTRSVNVCLADQTYVCDEQSATNGSHRSAPSCSPDEWHPFQAIFEHNKPLYGWWTTSASVVKTFATFEPAKPPIFIGSDRLYNSPRIP